MSYEIITYRGKEYYLVPVEEIKKVAFVAGHHEAAKGDYSSLHGMHEWDKWKAFLIELEDIGDIFLHNPLINSYTLRQQDMAEKTKDYDLVIELHWNAFDPDNDGDDDAYGTECYIWKGNQLMKQVGDYFCELMNEHGFRNRGCKPIDSGDGAGFLEAMVGDAILLEPFFADNIGDVSKYVDEIYIDVIKKIINKYYELK